MFILPPNPKQIDNYYGRNDLLPLPKTWEEFAPLTLIRSGGQVIPFLPFEYQKKLVELAEKHKKLVIIKSRQLGFTELWQNYALFQACTSAGASCFLFLRNGIDASTSSRRTKLMMQGLTQYVRAANDNVFLLKIAGGGEVNFKNSGAEGARGANSSTFLLFDEAAFIMAIARIFGATAPSGALSDSIGVLPCIKIVQSTPSARSGWYWDRLNENNGDRDIERIIDAVVHGELYSDNIPGFYYFVDDEGWTKVIAHWSCNPVYREIDNFLAWRKKEDKSSDDLVQREYQLKFNDQAVSVFDFGTIKSCAVSNWESFPEENCQYYGGLDTSTTGEDYCVFQVLKFKDRKYTLVHTYSKRKEDSQVHLFHLCKIIEYYKIKVVGVEVTGGVGHVYVDSFEKEFRGKGVKFKRLKTTQESKQKRISDIILAFEKQILTFPEKSKLLDELLSFRREGSKLCAAQGKHDDEIMSLSFAYDVASNQDEIERRDEEYLKNLSPSDKIQLLLKSTQE